MSGLPESNSNLDVSGGLPSDAIGREFEAAWQQALLGGSLPTIDSFLARAAEADRPALQAVLGSMDADYRRRMARLCSIEAAGVLDDDPVPIGGGTVNFEDGPLAGDPNVTAALTGDTSPDQTIGFGASPTDLGGTISPTQGSDAADDLGFSVTGASETTDPNPKARVNRPTRPDRVQVPGYEIQGVLGRGGMGVVYKALHLRLKRTVALKMVVAGAHAGAQDLARFYIEAEAIAQLQHPNIVQVYEIGDHDGLPFFALEYVDGGSLNGKLNAKPQPARDAARQTETLARAMAYAHLQGIIHRDLKPANVLITSDGQPKITDFGLAKKIEGDSGQTKSGTLMGTPNYMAPEQARGDTHEIGTLADVYSLGVILYEMLTGRTPFFGATILETLQLVQNQEPVPPRRLQPSVPADLDTITLKCLQKDPAKRYPSADALADDLRRFLADQPIQARPIGRAERAWRWCRRNPKVAALSATVLMLLVAVAVTSTVMAIRISVAHAATIEARDQAVAAKELADKNAAAEKAAREVADQQGALALKTIQSLITQVVQVQLGDEPRTQQLKIGLLKTALDGLEKASVRAEGLTGTSIQATMASAYFNMGSVFKQLGQTEEAIKYFTRCHEITQARAAAQPKRDASQGNLAVTFTLLGDMSQELRRDMTGSLGYYQKALAIRRELYLHPNGGEGKLDPLIVKQSLAEAHTRIGVTLLRLGDPAAALGPIREALVLRQQLADANPANETMRQDLAQACNWIGEASFLSGDPAAARSYYEKCLEVREALVKAHPDSASRKRDLAAASGDFGDVYLRSGDPAAARRQYDRSVALSRELADADPQNANSKRNLGMALYRLGTAARCVHDQAGAEARFRECLQIREDLAAKDPNNRSRQVELMRVLPHSGQHARAAAMAEKLRGDTPEAELLNEIACVYALCSQSAVDDQSLRERYSASAVAALADAVAHGYTDAVTLEVEPDLEPLRAHPAYQDLLKKMQAAVAAQRANASRH